MIKVNNIQVMNFENALRGARNPLESWDKSDSFCGVLEENHEYSDAQDYHLDSWAHIIHSDIEMEAFQEWASDNGILQYTNHAMEVALLGPNDIKLAQKLILAGSDHSKFMRQIFVSMDITAPLYWWKEMDTYKVGTTANSTSTMHKLATTPITRDCFSFDNSCNNQHDFNLYTKDGLVLRTQDLIDQTILRCEFLRQEYLETKDLDTWRLLIQLLPSSWNQTRTWTANYSVLRNIYFARQSHKLSEWRGFCKQLETLPYGKQLITLTKESEGIII